MYESPIREPLVTGGKTYSDVTRDILRPLENKPTTAWWVGFGISVVVFGIWIWAILYSWFTGVGTWGLNKNRRLGL